MAEQISETGTRFSSLFASLMAPFAPEQVEHREQGGQNLSYIDATTAANRLDDCLGPENWDFEAKPWGADALIGTLIVRMPDGTSMRKSSVGARPNMPQADDSFKGADSDCFKRCCDRLGVGRYLRKSGLPGFVMSELEMSAQDLAAVTGAGNRSSSPSPSRGPQSYLDARPANPPPTNGNRQFDDSQCPTSGRALFAWAKTKQDKGVEGVIDFINDHGKKRGWSSRMIDWNEGQVREAWDSYRGTA